MKKILILTAGFGEGHNSAARGIRDGLSQLRGAAACTSSCTIFSPRPTAWRTTSRARTLSRPDQPCAANLGPRVYRRLDRQQNFSGNFKVFFTLKKKFSALLGRLQPDVIVSVYPAYPHMLDEMLGPDRPSCGKRVVVITDSLTVNAIWYRCSADYFLLPNERSAAVLHRAGISPEKTKTFGFPVSPAFAEPGVSGAALDRTGRRVLYLINARRSTRQNWCSGSGARSNSTDGRRSDATAVCKSGREHARRGACRRFTMVGWSEELPRLLRESHLLISKAGGATVQEAMSAACPMIVNHVIPGQEEGNARLSSKPMPARSRPATTR